MLFLLLFSRMIRKGAVVPPVNAPPPAPLGDSGSTCLSRNPVELPKRAFITTTWKMRDYFPSAPLMGTLMRSSRNVQPFNSSMSPPPRSAQTFGNPQCAKKTEKKRKEDVGRVGGLHTHMCCQTPRWDFDLTVSHISS